MDKDKEGLKSAEDIIELEKERLNSAELKMRAADVELFYKNHFQKILALKEYEWLRSLGAKESSFKETAGQVIWHQGGLAMLKEIQDWFEDQVTLSLSRFEKEEESEPDEVIPSI